MIPQRFDTLRSVLCLGAHSDDIEIGCGGTLLQLLSANREIAVTWVVFSGIGIRGQEAHKSAEIFLAETHRKDIEVHEFQDTRFPYGQSKAMKDQFARLADKVSPDLVFTHRNHDAHQDHQLISDMTWQHFRNHLIFEYEIPKYEGDLGHPNVFVPLTEDIVSQKIDTLMDTFHSQREKYWFQRQTFESLLRMRGMECHSKSGFAEAFHCRKMVFE